MKNSKEMKTLVIMAGGMGSRYGGLKQIDGFGPNGETIMEYSIYDALQAGADKIVIVIQEKNEEKIREKLGEEIFSACDITFVYQSLKDCVPKGFDTSHRKKPWGTGHAVLVCKDAVPGPFVVINADDWYGREGMKKLFNQIGELEDDDFAMIGYELEKTLPEEGSVNRGICETTSNKLVNIKEHHGIHYTKKTIEDENGKQLAKDTIASINFWGFSEALFTRLGVDFTEFLQQFGDHPTKEFYITTVCNNLLEQGATCFVGTSSEKWSGVTHKDDKPALQQFLHKKVEEGYYPVDLW